MAVGAGGGAGAAGSKTVAATRIDVVDPHIVQMMRDVMSDGDTVPRLNPGGAGGGGRGAFGPSGGTPALGGVENTGGGGGGTDVAGGIIAGSVSGGGSTGGGNTNTPTVTLSANPYEIVAGDTTVLSWSSANATSCTASGSWSGTKSLTGTENITLDNYGDYTFSINCSGATASVDVTVSDEDSEGSCVNPHNAKIKESYLGNFDIPIPTGLFGEDHLKAIGFKDYGVKWIYQNYKGRNAAWISDCTEQEYIKLMYRTALRQLKKNGVETASSHYPA